MPLSEVSRRKLQEGIDSVFYSSREACVAHAGTKKAKLFNEYIFQQDSTAILFILFYFFFVEAESHCESNAGFKCLISCLYCLHPETIGRHPPHPINHPFNVIFIIMFLIFIHLLLHIYFITFICSSYLPFISCYLLFICRFFYETFVFLFIDL